MPLRVISIALFVIFAAGRVGAQESLDDLPGFRLVAKDGDAPACERLKPDKDDPLDQGSLRCDLGNGHFARLSYWDARSAMVIETGDGTKVFDASVPSGFGGHDLPLGVAELEDGSFVVSSSYFQGRSHDARITRIEADGTACSQPMRGGVEDVSAAMGRSCAAWDDRGPAPVTVSHRGRNLPVERTIVSAQTCYPTADPVATLPDPETLAGSYHCPSRHNETKLAVARLPLADVAAESPDEATAWADDEPLRVALANMGLEGEARLSGTVQWVAEEERGIGGSAGHLGYLLPLMVTRHGAVQGRVFDVRGVRDKRLGLARSREEGLRMILAND